MSEAAWKPVVPRRAPWLPATALAAAMFLSGCDGLVPPNGDPEAAAAIEAATQSLEGQVESDEDQAADVGAAEPEDGEETGTPEDGAGADDAHGDVEETEVAEEEPAPPDPNAEARRACERRGGIFAPVSTGSTGFCARETRDAMKACTRSTQCQGYCLARSRTCAPVAPLLGCHEVLDNRGIRSTICID